MISIPLKHRPFNQYVGFISIVLIDGDMHCSTPSERSELLKRADTLYSHFGLNTYSNDQFQASIMKFATTGHRAAHGGVELRVSAQQMTESMKRIVQELPEFKTLWSIHNGVAVSEDEITDLDRKLTRIAGIGLGLGAAVGTQAVVEAALTATELTAWLGPASPIIGMGAGIAAACATRTAVNKHGAKQIARLRRFMQAVLDGQFDFHDFFSHMNAAAA